MRADPQLRAVPRASGWLPLVGHLRPLMRDPLGFISSLREDGDVVRVELGRQPMVFVNSAELVHDIYVKQARAFDKGRLFDRMAPLVGGGLASADGETHLRHRRLIQPAFHRQRLAGYGDVIARRARDLADSLEPGREVAVDELMSDYAIGTLAETMFASDLGRPAIRAVRRDIPVVLDTMLTRALLPPVLDRLPIPANRRFLAAAARLRQVIDDVITATRQADDTHADLLSMLLAARDEETGAGLTDAEVRDELATMLFAGTETVASTFAWTFHELAEHPEAEQRLLAEIDEVVGSGPVAFRHVRDLTYTRAVLDEVIRLHGVVLLARRTARPVRLGDADLPAGTEVAFSLYAVNRDPRVYADADAFRPERWLADDRPAASEPLRQTFTPYGAGNRMCIGDAFARAEIALTLATVLPRWQLRSRPGYAVQEATAAMARPKHVPMTVHPRSMAPPRQSAA